MNLNQISAGMTLVFNPQGSSIRTLTAGNRYLVSSVGDRFVRIVDDSGRERGYLPEHFTVPTQAAGNIDAFDATIPPDSPERVYTLEDGSLTNPEGTVTTNQKIADIEEGTEFQVTEIRFGEESKELAIGIMYQPQGHAEEKLFFIPASYFHEGTSTADGSNIVITRDSNQRRLNLTAKVITLSSIGVEAGTLGEVKEVLEDNKVKVEFDSGAVLDVAGTSLRFLSPQDYQARIQRQKALQAQKVVQIQVGSRTYNVMSSSLDAISESVKRYAV